ncbi:hypothetical protein QJ856_gp0695 [Tupanvirus deep ocean]|uniref:Uncharacterized protein n=2 Tax=Tupanvirus TaxID=2094720 RepID=A0AC62A8F1_9VIRU|nr:hypothetical protein QJ856_gp0695 [Tupanvirus deep ocean]QKU34056.1 hypothetical protein [Tupanvirus deep ocean]
MKDYDLVKYKNKNYAVCRYRKKDGTNKLFVIDANNLNKILKNSSSWYHINGFIGYTKSFNGKSYCQYLHNLIMSNVSSRLKSKKYRINHINGHTHDNRRCNLKLTSQSSLNESKQPKKRTNDLPANCRIKPSDIPKCVHYCKPQSGHGEMFVIELIKDGKKYVWKSSSSKNILLEDKLVEIKKKLLDISKQHPRLMENKRIVENYTDEQIKLMKEYNDIIKLSKYNCQKNNLIKIPQKKVIKPDINKTFKETRKYLKTNTAVKSGRRHINKLPSDCGIIPAMIPKYCYYQAATDKRGDAFIIDRHPYLPQGKRLWSTSTSRNISTKDKFKKLISKLRELAKNRSNSGSKTSKPSKKYNQ